MLPDVTHVKLILLNLGLSGLLKAHGNHRPISVSMQVQQIKEIKAKKEEVVIINVSIVLVVIYLFQAI
jgi:hypothetical protein